MSQNSKPGLVLAGLMLGLLMASLDNTIVSTAMPTVIAQLGGMDIFSWVFSAYLLTSTAFIPVFGKLADMYGKKLFLLFGFIVFMIGSALSATAETMMQLIIYRAIQGIGAAPMMPIAFTMIFEIMPPEKRGRMQGLFSAVFGLSSVAGPTLGAYFTDNLSWHWIFTINIPIGILATAFIILFYKEQKMQRQASIDYAGIVTLMIAIVSLMMGLTMGGNEYAWDSWQILSMLIGSAVFTVIFLLVERRAKEPIIPLHLFNKGVVSSTGTSFFQGFVMIAAMTYIPLFIQGVLGGSATNAGNLLTPMMIAMIAGSAAGGMTMTKVPFRTAMLLSAVLMGASAYMLTLVDSGTTTAYMVVCMVIMGFSFGPLMPVTMMLTQMSVGRENASVGTSLVGFFRNIGMTLASSLLAVLVNNKVADGLANATANVQGIPPEMMATLQNPQVLLDEKLRGMIPPNVLSVMQDGLTSGVVQVFLVCTVVCVLMLLIAFLAGNRKLAIPPKPTEGDAPEGRPMEAHL